MAKKNYNELLHAIRPFVNFGNDIDLRKTPSTSEKSKISKYYKRLYGGTVKHKDGSKTIIKPLIDERRAKIYRPKSKKTRKALQELMPEFKGYDGLKAFPIVGREGDRVKLVISKKKLKKGEKRKMKIKLIGKTRTKVFVPIDPETIEEIDKIIRKGGEGSMHRARALISPTLDDYPEQPGRTYTISLLNGELGASTKSDRRNNIPLEEQGEGVDKNDKESIIDDCLKLMWEAVLKHYSDGAKTVRGFQVYNLTNQKPTDYFVKKKRLSIRKVK